MVNASLTLKTLADTNAGRLPGIIIERKVTLYAHSTQSSDLTAGEQMEQKRPIVKQIDKIYVSNGTGNVTYDANNDAEKLLDDKILTLTNMLGVSPVRNLDQIDKPAYIRLLQEDAVHDGLGALMYLVFESKVIDIGYGIEQFMVATYERS